MSDGSQRETPRKIYQVGELTRAIKFALEDTLGFVWIEGELSNVKRISSGHIYFTLKDNTSQISAALFKGSQRNLKTEVKDGLKVRIYGQITVYEPRGQYQIIVRQVEEAGEGDLQKAFEELKKQLAKEGLFDAEQKKELPLLPQRVGIVTSPTGAAIRDILHVLNRRFPNLHVIVAPAKVQGAGAAEDIARGITALNEHGLVDVMIVGRGGGSLEDLWSFNEEIVARAIHASTIPIISAVGHETDTTIADFTADYRAPTPSAAAEVVVAQKEAFEQDVARHADRMGRALRTRCLELKSRVVAAAGSYVFREPGNVARQFQQRIDGLHVRSTHALSGSLRAHQQRVDEAGIKLTHRIAIWHRTVGHDLRRLQSQLRALNPNAVLDRGYSITRGQDGRIIRTVDAVHKSDKLVTQVADGRIESDVTKTNQRDDHGDEENENG